MAFFSVSSKQLLLLLDRDPQLAEYIRTGTVEVELVVRLFRGLVAHLRQELLIELHPGLRDAVAVFTYAVKDHICAGRNIPDAEAFLFELRLIEIFGVLIDDDADAVIEGIFSFRRRMIALLNSLTSAINFFSFV